MINYPLEIKSHAKWILSGEHSVVRGGKAVAFPLRNYTNSLVFEKSHDFSIVVDQEPFRETVFALLAKASKFLEIPLEKVSGRISITGDIPLKAGLGSSAAICVNIARLFEYHGFCDDAASLARHLEDMFHRKSSGLDIAVALENRPIVFVQNKIVEFLNPKLWPHLVLSYSGEKSVTSHCADIIEKIFLENEKLALELDAQMDSASDLCEYALKNADFEKLKDGITLGDEVFHRWGLYTPSMSIHVAKLLSGGAVAAKPIGSGLGGYILSLWREDPSEFLRSLAQPALVL
jgi:mevalonate kinase